MKAASMRSVVMKTCATFQTSFILQDGEQCPNMSHRERFPYCTVGAHPHAPRQ
jgi:hypothetical protein